MLSDHEQRRLAEIEASLAGEDPSFAGRFRDSPSRRSAVWRRYAAVLTAIAGVCITVAGLASALVIVTVAGLILVGIAGGIWTWPQARRRRD